MCIRGLEATGGPGGYASCGEQVFLHQVNAPDQQVDVPDRAATHPAVHLDQAGAPAGELALHVEDTLQGSLSVTLQGHQQL